MSVVVRLSVVLDPYVDCIGNIHYREAAADPSFVVSGMTDFSVWSARDEQPQKLWSHQSSSADALMNTTDFATNASYLDDTHLVVANSNGYVSVFEQRFQSPA